MALFSWLKKSIPSEFYLAVPFSEKDEAKKHGAKWDANKNQWYAPNGEVYLLEKWPVNTTPLILHGEQLQFGGNDLFVDLIPRSCWFNNARTNIHPKDWDRVRDLVYKRVDYICECCKINTAIENIRLDAHERWEYNEQTKVQKLVRLVALCELCHTTTHIGLAQIQGKEKIAKKHLSSVRKFTEDECENHIQDAVKIWHERNEIDWSLDLSLLSDNGVTILPFIYSNHNTI